jgi:hypothetical protein
VCKLIWSYWVYEGVVSPSLSNCSHFLGSSFEFLTVRMFSSQGPVSPSTHQCTSWRKLVLGFHFVWNPTQPSMGSGWVLRKKHRNWGGGRRGGGVLMQQEVLRATCWFIFIFCNGTHQCVFFCVWMVPWSHHHPSSKLQQFFM